jgi:hypothetical protein
MFRHPVVPKYYAFPANFARLFRYNGQALVYSGLLAARAAYLGARAVFTGANAYWWPKDRSQ